MSSICALSEKKNYEFLNKYVLYIISRYPSLKLKTVYDSRELIEVLQTINSERLKGVFNTTEETKLTDTVAKECSWKVSKMKEFVRNNSKKRSNNKYDEMEIINIDELNKYIYHLCNQ